jgi:aspartate kinase
MSIVVQKFGGTSLQSPKHILEAVKRIFEARERGHQVVVVVSAMGDDTDRLLRLLDQVSVARNFREYDMLLSSGEQVAMSLLASALCDQGALARSCSAGQIKIHAEGPHGKAKIEHIQTDLLLKMLGENIIPVVAGFQGINRHGEVVTLGRGGSDLTAVALAAALHAEECQIFTDVAGVYTADPRRVKDAVLLEEIDFEVMLELASMGAEVLQMRSVKLAWQYGVNLRVLPSNEMGRGTMITMNKPNKRASASGIAFQEHEALVRLQGVELTPTILAKVMERLQESDIAIDMLSHLQQEDENRAFTFSLPQEKKSACEKILKEEFDFSSEQFSLISPMAKISLVGVGLNSHAKTVSHLLSCLAEANIPIHLMTLSEIKLAVLIDQVHLDVALNLLHQAFKLEAGIKHAVKS